MRCSILQNGSYSRISVIICEDTTIHNNCTSGDKEDFGMFCEKDCNIRLITTEMEQTREDLLSITITETIPTALKDLLLVIGQDQKHG